MTAQQPNNSDTGTQAATDAAEMMKKTAELLAENDEIIEKISSKDHTEQINSEVDALMDTVNKDLEKAMQQLGEQLQKINDTMQTST